MSRLNRFYIAGAHSTGDVLQLDAERSNYLCRVLRMSEGDELDIFDGVGGLYRCRLCHDHQRRAKIEVVQGQPGAQTRKRAFASHSLAKGQAMDRAIQQATELAHKTFGYCKAHAAT